MAERPTPLSLAVCVLIAFQADRRSPYYEIEIDQDARERAVQILQDAVSRGWSNGIQDFLRKLQTDVGPQLSSLMMDYLNELCTSIDALMDLMDSLQKAIAANTVDGASPPGIFVRKTCLGFDTLSFETIARLWETLKEEVERCSLESIDKREIQNESTGTLGAPSSWPLSPSQIEAELMKLCLDMEKSDHSYEETELKIQRVMKNDPDLPTVHFLRFLNCIRHGERVDALYALHKYFDFVRIREYRAAKDHKPDLKTRNGVLPYASIVLAALHHSFGEYSLSLKATEEAVRVAQESNDTACVAYALGWLYVNRPGSDAEELLRKCASRAGDARALVAGAHMSLAQHYLGSNVSAARAWESVYSASALGAVSTTITATTLDRPARVSNDTSSEDAMVVLVKQALVGAGVWESCGLPVMSGQASQVALDSYPNGMTRQDQSLAIYNIARVALCGPNIDSSCRYATALRTISKSGSSQEPCGPIMGVALVLHEWAIRRGDLAHAHYLTSVLHSSFHSRVSNHTGAFIDILSQYSLLLMRQEQWKQAYNLTQYLCTRCQKQGLRSQHALHLIQLATIQLQSSPNEFIGALPPLIECLSMCDRLSMDTYHAAALSVLAQVHLRLRNTNQAIALLKASLPCLLQQMHTSFAAEAYLTLAKCHLHRAKRRELKNGNTTIRILRSASVNLKKCRQLFYECHDLVRLKEVYYLQALTYNSIPDLDDKRNEASRQFLQASKQLAKSRHGGAQFSLWGSLRDATYVESLVTRPLLLDTTRTDS